MTRAGRWFAVAAATLALVTVATWDQGGEASGVAEARLDGAGLFHARGCSACHTGPDSNAFSSMFPTLTDASSWAGARRPGMTAADYVAESMIAPGAFISPEFNGNNGPTTMPQLQLTTAEIDALVEYLLRS